MLVLLTLRRIVYSNVPDGRDLFVDLAPVAKLASTAHEPIYAWFCMFFEWSERIFYPFRGRISIYENGSDKAKSPE